MFLNKEEYYSQLKPIIGEELYVDFDDDTGYWCVFGSDSGFAYSSWESVEQANEALKQAKP